MTLVAKKKHEDALFCLWLGMSFFHHASEGLSREAKRLDSPSRHGTLAHALPGVSASSLSLPFFTGELLELDIEGLSRSQ
jgi:hypothetical protein